MMDLTNGSITTKIIKFSLPLMLGNLLQQMYNIADTWVVGRVLGADALAAVGSSYTLMVFLTSILLGLCMGSGVEISMQYGKRAQDSMRRSIFMSFLLILGISVVLNVLVYAGMDGILWILRIPAEVTGLMKDYLLLIFAGILATFLYNYCANVLRAVGNSVVPLVFLGISSVLNVGLDLFFVIRLQMGVQGAALATVIAQYVSGLGILAYTCLRFRWLLPKREDCHWEKEGLLSICNLSFLTCLQQSIMNFGILMVQGLVNSFGTAIMAAFAAAVKIDSFAYMPVQDFGNAFSTFIAQNYGAKEKSRIHSGLKGAVCISAAFCVVISVIVCIFARQLMMIFTEAQETEVIAEGVRYLRIEGAFYCGIGCLFLLYGLYRALGKPGMSVVLTVISLGTRVALAYLLSAIPVFGVTGIWWSVPIGWVLADITGVLYYKLRKKALLSFDETKETAS